MPRYDDDDRPRKRRPRDDEDEGPRSRRRARDDEEEGDRPSGRRRAHRNWRDADEDDDRPRRKKRRPTETSTVGAIGLVIGGFGLLVSFMPCFASISLIPAGIGLIVGFVGLYLAQRSDGRQGYGVPITAMSVSTAAVLVAVSWLYAGKWFGKKSKEFEARIEAEAAKEDVKRKAELAKAAREVQAANPDAVVRVTAAQFYQACASDDGADEYYKNKVIEVTGIVHEVDLTDEEEEYTVELKGGPVRFSAVHCHFAKDPATRAKLAQLQPGQTVTIRGKCLGDGPVLEACILVQ